MNYQEVYNKIIQQARSENRRRAVGTYYEAHHILPICLGGEGKTSQWKSHPNIILLTAREHFICHRLLCRIHPTNSRIKYAFWTMCTKASKSQHRYIPSSRAFEEARRYIKDIQIGKPLKEGSVEKRQRTRVERGITGQWTEDRKLTNKQYRILNPYKHSEESLKKMRVAQIRACKHTPTGNVYKSVKEAANSLSYSVPNMNMRFKRGEFVYI